MTHSPVIEISRQVDLAEPERRPALKVLIHALGADMGGAKRHLFNFIPALARLDETNEYTVLVRESLGLEDGHGSVRVQRVADRFTDSAVSRLIYDLWKGPHQVRRGRFDVVVSLTNFGPVWTRIPHVVFQRNALYYFPGYLKLVSRKKRIEVLLRRHLAHETMQRATMVVTPSDAMADMIRAIYPDLASKPFCTLYHGFAARSMDAPLEWRYQSRLSKESVRLLYPTQIGRAHV